MVERLCGFESRSGHHIENAERKEYTPAMELKCKYGCENQALYGDRCQPSYNSCPAVKKKNSIGGKRAWKTKKPYFANLPEETKNRMAWSRGKTKENDKSLAERSKRMKGKRRITDEEKLKKVIYSEQCKFNINECITRILGYNLLVEFGMYHRISNKEGVARDHRLSVDKGFRLGLDPSLVSHPANCRFLKARDNSKKSRASEISEAELRLAIEQWEKETP